MYPLLFKIGPVPIHSYGFMIAMGFLTAVFVIRKLSEASRLNVEKVVDLTFWGLLVGFAGCRILYVLTRLDYFLAYPLAIFKVWEGGLVFLGGPLFVVPFIIFYSKKHKLPVWKVVDVVSPGLVIAHSLGRVGCLAAGCCYGKPTGEEWGLRLYSQLVEEGLRGVPLHPTQIYSSISLFLLFLGLLWTFKKKVFDGQVALTYCIVYPIVRSVIEIYRGDLIRGFVIQDLLSTSQFISILVFILATIVLFIRLGQVRKA